jgi:hypothetical protein
MTLPYRGSARLPGPLGSSPGTLGGRIPGPLRFGHVDLAKGKTTPTKATREVAMPPPWGNSTPKRVRSVDWNLSDGTLRPDDVKQGGLPVCPVASILAALAHTAVGQKHLNAMVSEYSGVAIKTVLSDAVMAAVAKTTADDPDYRPQEKEIVSNRYFMVKFWKGEVPDTLYVEYTDGSDLSPVFMSSPNRVLWPAVIEKACAFSFGSYVELGNYRKHPVNEYWELIVGSKPQGFEVADATNLEKIRQAAEAAPRIPTVAASRDNTDRTKVTPWHGLAILGMRGSSIELYDPAKAKTITLSLEDFRSNFKAIFYGNP